MNLSLRPDYVFDWSVVQTYLPYFLQGLLVTLKISVLAQLVGVIVGLLAALARLSRFRALRWPAVAYIDFFRGIPILVILLWVYYGYSILLGLEMSATQGAIIGLGASYGAYLAEIFRAGIQAVPSGQREAAQTLGLTRGQTLLRVVLPQAFRIVVPPFGNTFISMLKDSSLVSILAVNEVMHRATVAAGETFRPFELFLVVAIMYYLMTLIVARVVSLLERRLAPAGMARRSSQKVAIPATVDEASRPQRV